MLLHWSIWYFKIKIVGKEYKKLESKSVPAAILNFELQLHHFFFLYVVVFPIYFSFPFTFLSLNLTQICSPLRRKISPLYRQIVKLEEIKQIIIVLKTYFLFLQPNDKPLVILLLFSQFLPSSMHIYVLFRFLFF